MKIGMRIPGKMAALSVEELARWAAANGLDAIDLPEPSAEFQAALGKAGLQAGSVDVDCIPETLSRDENARGQGVAALKAQIDKAAELGLKTIFCCLIPSDRTMARRDTFAIFVETYPDIVSYAASRGVALAMEPYPGPAPHYPTIGCTPEMYRAMFHTISSPALGICYDPSHYVRLGIDYLRVLAEFGDRVRHVHAKDTEILSEGRYLHGTAGETFPGNVGWSGGDWRYSIPGTGEVDWAKVVAHLRMSGYDGVLSIELEDHLYAHTPEGSKEGVGKAARYLRGVI